MAKTLKKSDLSQRRVLDAAARTFLEHGYAGTTMRAVADAAGMKAGSIYYYYQSKEELISAVLDFGIRAVIDKVRFALNQLPNQTSGRIMIQTAVKAHLSAILDVGDYTLATRRVFGQVPQPVRIQNRRLQDSYAALWQSLLVEAQKRGEFRPDVDMRLVRLFVHGALNWIVEWFKPGGLSLDEIASEFTNLILNGVQSNRVEVRKQGPAPSARKNRISSKAKVTAPPQV